MIDFICEIPNVLSAEDISWLQENIDKARSYGEGSVGNRKGDTVSISVHKDSSPYLQQIEGFLDPVFERIFVQVAPTFKPRFTPGSAGYEYHRYFPGDVCSEHADSDIEVPYGTLRWATVILHLTDNPDGILFFPNQKRSIATEAGKAVVFPPYSLFPHYTTSSSTTRDVILTWFTYPTLSVVGDMTEFDICSFLNESQ